ncbi:MAG: tetratricopeptide repeat protein [Acidobacteriota bacterium]
MVNPSLILSALSVHLRRSFARRLLALLPILCLLPSPLAQAQTGAGTQAAARSETDARTLKMGEPVERELAGGQQHAYQISLNAGEYLNLAVEQLGIDVVVKLIAPDGKQLLEVDSPNGEQGPEPLAWIAALDGTYWLEVRSLEKDAKAGRYQAKLIELRRATPNDRAQVTQTLALQEAEQLSAEAVRLRQAGQFDKALPVAERALAIREKTLGAEHLDTTSSLNTFALIHQDKGDYAKAEPLFQRALAIREKNLGAEHSATALSLNNLAELYRIKGNYTNAEPLFQRALTIREKSLGVEHPETASSLNSLGLLYTNKGDYAKAEPLFQRALAIRENTLGAEHPFVANLLDNLGELYRAKGDYAKAEPIYQRTLTIREKRLGAEHPGTATSLNNLALLYEAKGDYVKAEPLYQRSLKTYEKTLGAGHPYTANSINNLALLYKSKGDYEKAEPLFQRALANREKTFGAEHPDTAISVNNLAELYRAKGDFAKAEPLYQRALAINEKTLGAEHPTTAISLNNLALLYRSRGDDAKAEPLYQRALTIHEKKLGAEHPSTATSLNNLAAIYKSKGDYAKAESLHQRALAIYEKSLGVNHPLTATSLNNLAALSESKGDAAQAVALRLRASAIEERNIAINTRTGSERQKQAYLATLMTESESAVSLHARSAPKNAAARDLALTVILQRKGRALDAMTNAISLLRKRINPEDQALLDRLQDLRSQYARLVLTRQPQTAPAEHQAKIKAAEAQIEEMEAEVSRRSDEFRVLAQPVTVAAVQSAIPAETVLVEYFSYRPFNAKDRRREPRRYIAYILRRHGEAQWMDLGEAKAIDEAVAKLRQTLRDKTRQDVKLLAREVDRLVMQPLRPLFGKSRRILLSPDGTLNLVPFAALVDEKDRYLVRKYEFSYLTSGRDLLRLQTKPAKQPKRPAQTQTALVVANPDFGEETKDSPVQERILRYRPGVATATGKAAVLSNFYFPPLPGTAQEADALKAAMGEATVLTQGQATETAIKQVSRPLLLHIATHGFFLENQPPVDAKPEIERIENPLLRSGLALASANLRKDNDEDDGILTAQEVAGLNLWGTKLVVLSACDTGVGEVKAGEGVYGLRRALVLAGSESQVMSLWPVSDQATRDLMIEYYRCLLKGEGRSEALRRVQLRMLKADAATGDEGNRVLVTKRQQNKDQVPAKDERKPGEKLSPNDYSHPYYWASFIQSGEWANLEGKR